MTCGEVSERLAGFLEDLLPEEEYQEILQHLGQCLYCNKEVSRIGALSNQLRELGKVVLPPGLNETLLSQSYKGERDRELLRLLWSKEFVGNLIFVALVTLALILTITSFFKQEI